MTDPLSLDQIDRTGLMREAFRIEDLTPEQARSIFLDWALQLPSDVDSARAISAIIDAYGVETHPMYHVLQEGLAPSATPRRRGGPAGRRS